MAFSSSEFTGDGTTRVFSFSFTGPGNGYIRQSDVHVFIGGVAQTGFTFPTANSIELATAPADGAFGLVRRIMPKEEPYSNFARGSNFSRIPVNNSFLQQLYTQHEVIDGYAVDAQQENFDLGAHKIINLSNGTDPQDAVTKAQLDADTIINTSLRDETIVLRDATQVLRNAAQVSETNAKASEVQADLDEASATLSANVSMAAREPC